MRSQSLRALVCMIFLGLALAACSAPAATPEPDRVATRVAEELAVAATLTAAAPPPPTNTPATDTPGPPNTPVPPPLTPTPTREIERVIPGAGNPNGLEGQIVLPGNPELSGDIPIFQRTIAFHLRVYDPAAGTQNGAGIQSVDFAITDPEGKTVHERTEQNPKYCAFGGGDGDQPCNVLVFADFGNLWPNGPLVISDVCCYKANMVVHTQDPDKDEANWLFDFIVRLP